MYALSCYNRLIGTINRISYCTIECTSKYSIVHLFVHVKRKENIITTSYEKEVKHRLIDRGMTQVQLCKLVNEKTGLRTDPKYMSKVLTGKRHPPRVINAINEILEIEQAPVSSA